MSTPSASARSHTSSRSSAYCTTVFTRPRVTAVAASSASASEEEDDADDEEDAPEDELAAFLRRIPPVM